MNSSNSFNICTRCGNSNALNAKYCSRCGIQLKVPEEPVLCHKCHTRNNPMANFCRNCGAPLKVAPATKLCPKCGREVNAEDSVCVCGYSFVTLQQKAPNNADVANQPRRQSIYDYRGGRVFAAIALVLLLLCAYYIVMPAHIGTVTMRPVFDGGIASGNGVSLYGADVLVYLCRQIFGMQAGGVGDIILGALVAIFAITAFVHLVVCIVRLAVLRRSRQCNWYFCTMAIISTVIAALFTVFSLVTVSSSVGKAIASVFTLSYGAVGWAIWAIPLYYWLFFVYSVIAKAKRLKEQS